MSPQGKPGMTKAHLLPAQGRFSKFVNNSEHCFCKWLISEERLPFFSIKMLSLVLLKELIKSLHISTAIRCLHESFHSTPFIFQNNKTLQFLFINITLIQSYFLGRKKTKTCKCIRCQHGRQPPAKKTGAKDTESFFIVE